MGRVAVLVCVAAIGVASGCRGEEHASCENQAFDRAGWRSAGGEGRSGLLGGASQRQRLADRMIACQTLAGRRRSDVRHLLGRPDYPSRASRYYYELGGGRSAGPLDNEFLSVRFDRRARVETVAIVGF